MRVDSDGSALRFRGGRSAELFMCERNVSRSRNPFSGSSKPVSASRNKAKGVSLGYPKSGAARYDHLVASRNFYRGLLINRTHCRMRVDMESFTGHSGT